MLAVRTRNVLLTVAGLVAVALVAGSIVVDRLGDDDAQDARTCDQPAQTDPTAVRTTREWTSADIPGVGDYVEIHWQSDSPGGADCSRVPGPTDWEYEGVLRLRDTDVDTGAFAAWPPATDTPLVRPALKQFVPEGVRWRHGGGYPQRVKNRNVDLYVDPDHAVAWFILSTD